MCNVMKIVIVAISLIFWGCGTPVDPTSVKGDKGDKGDPGTSVAAVSDCTVIAETTFGANSGTDWKLANWYDTSKQPVDTIQFLESGVYFSNPSTNSHSTIQLNTGNFDVSGCDHLYLKFSGVVTGQTLPGTGMDDREAPLGLTVKYTDASGVLHSSLNAYNESEPDDRLTTRMFWKGFTIDTSAYMNANAVEVTKDVEFEETFDLMTLSPKPKTIHFVAISSAGWPSVRSSIAKSISLKDDATSVATCDCKGIVKKISCSSENMSTRVYESSTDSYYLWRYDYVEMGCGDTMSRGATTPEYIAIYEPLDKGDWQFNASTESNAVNQFSYSGDEWQLTLDPDALAVTIFNPDLDKTWTISLPGACVVTEF